MFNKKEYHILWGERNKEHIKQKGKEYRLKNKEILSKKAKEYYSNNIEYLRQYKKEWRKNNFSKIRKNSQKYIHNPLIKKRIIEQHKLYYKQKRKEDLGFLILGRLRNRLAYCFRIYSKTGKILPSKSYGVDFKAIIKYLGKCPSNNYKEWHIHHIIPCANFDFTNPNQIKEAFAPENHMWLPAKENLKRGAKCQDY